MADKTILDFPVLTDNLDTDEMYVLRGTGTGRDRHQSRLAFLQDILLFGVPEHSLTREYTENTGMCQDEGMIWASSFAGANIGNKPSTNQDKWNPVSAPTKPETISVTGAFTTLYRHHHITSDTSGGNNTLTLDDGLFDGQTIDIGSDGSGVTYLKGTGLYLGVGSLGIPVTDGLKCFVKWDASLSKWKADYIVTADYISGIYQIIQYSNGDMEIIMQDTVVYTTSTASGGIFTSPATPAYLFPLAFAVSPYIVTSANAIGANFWCTGAYTRSTAGYTTRAQGATVSQTGSLSSNSREKY